MRPIVRLKFALLQPYTQQEPINASLTRALRDETSTMTLLSWRDDYRVGVPLIDTEHEYLIGLINEFHDKHASHVTRPQAMAVLNKLVIYAERHFRHEEALMAKIGFPRLAHQEQLHEQLYSSIFALHEELSMEHAEVDGKTMRFLRYWLLDHILDEDMDIGEFLRRKTAKAAKAADEEEHRRVEEKTAAEAKSKGETGKPAVAQE